ncbi:APC family permease [Clostridium botulinum]|uniref:APC family permease n=1 Tax=Clostridium botulinum TaxID=1491 RepID=A0A6B4GXL7_CLOBO|nr:APC family permease [Clostridium botulinum]KRU24317.1 amino acid permease [Clostridium sporogenes]KRU26092.1 amino acid permease [Clostridium sporogenes]KRU27148.1 amino acid permease [Clostridium sporogenes]KRU49008.1 amino acid permease [Clostridium sporogenes]MBZ1328681.1 APC family permease [Clostridium botulinum]
MIKKFLDILIGQPLPNEKSSHERYNVPFGLAIMASDAVSSVSYAAEEILGVLIAVIGLASYKWLGWVSLMIIILLLILTVSYIQIIHAYPHGGGAYVVAKENINLKSGLIAASALLVDYILTVAVSSSAGVAAIISAFPSLGRHKIILAVSIIIILTILNLRGVSESAKIFSLPAYLFILSMIFMIIYGLIKYSMYGAPEPMVHSQIKATGELSVFLILKAFSSGCSALTGLEAVSNSVPNFKEPSQKNAKTVMILLSCLILFIFGGTSILARFYRTIPVGYPTVIAQLAYGIFGQSFMFYVIQFTTAMILIMACNTAFTGFPMLMYTVGKDGFVPRQFTVRGKRLGFSNGIVALSFVACLLVITFNAETHSLLPLYAVGVFLSFTLAQAGMVKHWSKNKEKGWRSRSIINAFGAFLAAATTLIIAYEKFRHGAWMVIIVIPILVASMLSIKKHYNSVAIQLRVETEDLKDYNLNKPFTQIIVVPIASLNKAALATLQYARSLSSYVIALNVSTDNKEIDKLKNRWAKLDTDILLVSKYSTYRTVVTPLLGYINQIANATSETEKITVMIPQFITHEGLGEVLHNHTGFIIRESLLRNKNVIVSTYPYHLEDTDVEI